eukprot:5777665-Pleurochrysis_carterae.AAC.1
MQLFRPCPSILLICACRCILSSRPVHTQALPRLWHEQRRRERVAYLARRAANGVKAAETKKISQRAAARIGSWR